MGANLSPANHSTLSPDLLPYFQGRHLNQEGDVFNDVFFNTEEEGWFLFDEGKVRWRFSAAIGGHVSYHEKETSL